MIPSLPGLRREKSVLISPVGGRRTSRDDKWENVMWTLDKDAIARQPNAGSASPTLILIALGLFSLLVLGAADVHRDLLIAAIFAVGEYGIEPLFVGP